MEINNYLERCSTHTPVHFYTVILSKCLFFYVMWLLAFKLQSQYSAPVFGKLILPILTEIGVVFQLIQHNFFPNLVLALK